MTALLLVTALTGLAKTILTGELRGLLSDRSHRAVDRAARLLPPDLADDLAAEWHAELTALEAADRLVSACRFARSLPRAAAQIGDPPPLRTRLKTSRLARLVSGDIAVLSSRSQSLEEHVFRVTLAMFLVALGLTATSIVGFTLLGRINPALAFGISFGVLSTAFLVLRASLRSSRDSRHRRRAAADAARDLAGGVDDR
jgi:hypothetical protein